MRSDILTLIDTYIFHKSHPRCDICGRRLDKQEKWTHLFFCEKCLDKGRKKTARRKKKHPMSDRIIK